MHIPAGTEALGNAINQSLDTIRKFLSGPQVRALLVARHNLKDEEESKKENLDDNVQGGAPSSLTPFVYYRLSVDVHYSVGAGAGGAVGSRSGLVTNFFLHVYFF